jgi:hypothetical protein
MATTFEQELKSFKARLTPGEQSSFTGTTLEDLRLTVASIQETQISERTNRNVARLRHFLEAIESYSKVLDVFVNISEFVAFVWGPIKYLLLVSMPSVSSRQINRPCAQISFFLEEWTSAHKIAATLAADHGHVFHLSAKVT